MTRIFSMSEILGRVDVTGAYSPPRFWTAWISENHLAHTVPKVYYIAIVGRRPGWVCVLFYRASKRNVAVARPVFFLNTDSRLA